MAIGLPSEYRAAQPIVFNRGPDPHAMALEYHHMALGYTLAFAGPLLGLCGGPAANRDTVSTPSTRKGPRAG